MTYKQRGPLMLRSSVRNLIVNWGVGCVLEAVSDLLHEQVELGGGEDRVRRLEETRDSVHKISQEMFP